MPDADRPAAAFAGRCHCSALGYTYRPSQPPSRWSVRACQCRFCRAHGALSTSDPAGSLAFEVNDPARLVRYRFGLRTADFLLCSECGVYVGAVLEDGSAAFGIINTRTLEPQPDDMAAVGAISYEGEDEAGRAARRVQRWTPVSRWPRP